MKGRIVGAVLAGFCLALATSPPLLAAPLPSGKPGIRITNLHEGQTIPSSTVTVDVAVSHFKLVPPILLSPSRWKTIPLLKGNQGHIHYVLDSIVNMVLTRDVTVRTSHTWTNVKPGEHTVMVYLATSQHALFPGTKTVSVHVIVEPQMKAAAQRSAARVKRPAHRKARARVRRAVHIKAIPKTGGADGGGLPDQWPLLLVGLALLSVGLGVRRRSP